MAHQRDANQVRERRNGEMPTDQRDLLTNLTPDRNEGNTDFDIIAIHGLDTKSPDTWTWKSADGDVNWLADAHMLPSQVKNARIFTYDWYTQMFPDANLTQVSVDQHAAFLLLCIQRTLFDTEQPQATRPILFIASCLGGLILAKALILADGGNDNFRLIRRATGAVVFLATPFRGTSFEHIASWAKVGLSFRAVLQDKCLIELIRYVGAPTDTLADLTLRFTNLCQDTRYPIETRSFFELKKTNLTQKALPWLPGSFRDYRLLVDQSSASLDIMHENPPVGLMRPHPLMNKFMGPECRDYKRVCGVIQSTSRIVWQGSLIHQADTIIRKNNYAEKELEIIRLSGDSLSMSRCYINLATVRSMSKNDQFDEMSDPFLLTPKETTQVHLESLFDERDGTHPRRILIRGRAGMGKTTLCKKIIHEFYHENAQLQTSWAKVFDRILWIPLRNLKEMQVHSLDQLFLHTFFQQPQERRHLADEYTRRWEQIRSKTLFLLDGLDEIQSDLVQDSSADKFLKALLNQENVIITSRPSAGFPPDVTPLHLDLEVIGFHPDQVKTYVKHVFRHDEKPDEGKIAGVLDLLDRHPLLQGLMCIPIQLDALCFTWSDWLCHSHTKQAPQTMTAIFKMIEKKLWMKDIVKMQARDSEGQLVTRQHISSVNIPYFTGNEQRFLELLAFSGLHDDKIVFDTQYQDSILTKLGLQNFQYAKKLPRLSFLRVLNPTLKVENRKYYFIHLTFQEYFAARYFARKWQAPQAKLDIPGSAPCTARDYVCKHKYFPRYDVFWRFVAGLLRNESERTGFLQVVEQEPLDWLGFTHQRLIMRILRELPRELQVRSKYEERLKEWVLFEHRKLNTSYLAAENEFPEALLHGLLQQETKGEEDTLLAKGILDSLAQRPYLSQKTMNIIILLLETVTDSKLCQSVYSIVTRPLLLRRDTACYVVKYLEGKVQYIRRGLLIALADHANVPDEVVAAMASCMYNTDADIRRLALKSLGQQASLPDSILNQMDPFVYDTCFEVRSAAARALSQHFYWSDNLYECLTELLNAKDTRARCSAVRIFAYPTAWPLEERFQMLLVRKLADQVAEVRETASDVLRDHTPLPAHIVPILERYIRSSSPEMQISALSSLGGDEVLSDQLFDDLMALWKTRKCEMSEYKVRRHITGLICRLVTLPPTILPVLAGWMMDNTCDRAMRVEAQRILIHQRGLPTAVQQILVAGLTDRDFCTKMLIAEVLKECPRFSDQVFEDLVNLLEEKNLGVAAAVCKTLWNHPKLPTAVQTKVGQLIALNGHDIRFRTIGCDNVKLHVSHLGTPPGTCNNLVNCPQVPVCPGHETAAGKLENGANSLYTGRLRELVENLDRACKDALQHANFPMFEDGTDRERLVSTACPSSATKTSTTRHAGSRGEASRGEASRGEAIKLFLTLMVISRRKPLVMFNHGVRIYLLLDQERVGISPEFAKHFKGIRAELAAPALSINSAEQVQDQAGGPQENLQSDVAAHENVPPTAPRRKSNPTKRRSVVVTYTSSSKQATASARKRFHE